MVNKKQLPKRKGTVAFWRNVMEEWNTTHPEAKYASWKAISVAYGRILKNRQMMLGKPRKNSRSMGLARVIYESTDETEHSQKVSGITSFHAHGHASCIFLLESCKFFKYVQRKIVGHS